MRNLSNSFFCLLLIAIVFSCKKDPDTIDGGVKIGDQVWMKKNLDVAFYSNGDAIPQATTEAEWKYYNENQIGAWSYLKFDESYNERYGKLYNWYVIGDKRGVAPKGWRVPTSNDFNVLINYAGGESVAGENLKSDHGWDCNSSLFVGCKQGKDKYGFEGLPAGEMQGGSFYNAHIRTNFWTSTDGTGTFCDQYCSADEYADQMTLDYERDDAVVSADHKNEGLSIRCIEK